MNLIEAAFALRKKQVSSVELTAESLSRTNKLNPKLNNFLMVLEESARASAAQADKELASGIDRGPLHGIPVAMKDVFYTKGIRTTGGSKLFADHVPSYDSTVVERLKKAGVVIVGKTNMHELALGITSNNPHYGPVRNAWDPSRIPGGSSGGSGSAVSALQVFMATGNDTGGSVRIPGSFCGVVGLKPTFGRISRYGILPLDFSLDHAGILTRTVRETAITLKFVAGYDPHDDTSSQELVDDYALPPEVSIRDVRVGWCETLNSQGVDPEVAQAVRRMAETAESLGAKIVPVTLPDYSEINAIHRVILHSEVSALVQPYLSQRDKFSPGLLALLQQGCLLSAADYVNAQRLRRLVLGDFMKVFEQIDCLINPTTPTAAPKIGQDSIQAGDQMLDVRLVTTSLVRAANLTGFPAVSIPCGFNQEGLPLGLQIMARPFEEKLILRIGAALEDATEFHKKTPAIAA